MDTSAEKGSRIRKPVYVDVDHGHDLVTRIRHRNLL
jgi:hypothetical protein